jgi:hypothetical protein
MDIHIDTETLVWWMFKWEEKEKDAELQTKTKKRS